MSNQQDVENRIQHNATDSAVINGLYKNRYHDRVYPYHELASQIIGYTNEGNQGITGIENYFESFHTKF